MCDDDVTRTGILPTAELGTELRALDPGALLSTLLAEEAELDLDRFGLDSAWTVGSIIRNTAIEQGLGISVAVELGEQRAFHAGTPGSAALNDAWLARKFRVVRHYGHASLTVRAQYAADGGSFREDSALDPLRYAADGGAFPLRVRGSLVGVIGVSGLEMHADHALVVAALRASLR